LLSAFNVLFVIDGFTNENADNDLAFMYLSTISLGSVSKSSL